MAPITEYEAYENKLLQRLGEDNDRLSVIGEGIKAQRYSSLFFLPPHHVAKSGFVCHFDEAFSFPTEELRSYLPDIDQTRICSLDYFGYYLFPVKLSYHFCRLPEEQQR